MSTSEFPGFDHLYVLGQPGADSAFTAVMDIGGADELAVTRGETVVAGGNARWELGRAKPAPLVWTSAVHSVLLSRELKDAMLQAGLTGWSTYPVSLAGKGGETYTYEGLIVTGRCGALDPSRSISEIKQYPARAVKVLRGLFFDEQSWDGSDFFMTSSKTGWIFLSERAKRTLEDGKSGAEFRTLDSVQLRQMRK